MEQKTNGLAESPCGRPRQYYAKLSAADRPTRAVSVGRSGPTRNDPARRAGRSVTPSGAAIDYAIESGGVRYALTTGYPLRFLRNGGCAPTRAAPAGIDRRWQPEADAQRCISAAQLPTHETIPQGSQKVAGGRRAAAYLRKTGPIAWIDPAGIADACSPGSTRFADHALQIVGLGTRQPHGVIGCSAAIFEQDQIAAGLTADFLKHLHKVGTRDAAGA